MATTSEAPRRARRLASGGPIREAATALFLEKGYAATSMDEIAAQARVSKQTIYTHFRNKEELFADLVLGNVERVDASVGAMRQAIRQESSLEDGLRLLARDYLGTVMRPEVLRLRRLVLGEAGRFPELARAYYEQVPGRVYEALAELFAELSREGRLRLGDPRLAAHHFAWLVLGMPLDRAMFLGAGALPSRKELERLADSGSAAFLAIYRPS